MPPRHRPRRNCCRHGECALFQARVLLLNQPAIGRAALIQRIIGDRGERGLQCRQSFSGRLRARELLMPQCEAAVRIQTGTTLRSKWPASMARAARFWLSSANASTSARLIFSKVAMASAQTPWCDCGCSARRCSFPGP